MLPRPSSTLPTLCLTLPRKRGRNSGDAPVALLPFARAMIGLPAQARRLYPDPFGGNVEEGEHAAHRAGKVGDHFFVNQLQRSDAVLRKKLPPSGILGRADPNETLDLIEVKSRLSLAAALVWRGVGMPKPGLFCAVMGDRAGDCILADEVDVAQVGEMPAQPLHRRLGGAVQFGNQM